MQNIIKIKKLAINKMTLSTKIAISKKKLDVNVRKVYELYNRLI